MVLETLFEFEALKKMRQHDDSVLLLACQIEDESLASCLLVDDVKEMGLLLFQGKEDNTQSSDVRQEGVNRSPC